MEPYRRTQERRAVVAMFGVGGIILGLVVAGIATSHYHPGLYSDDSLFGIYIGYFIALVGAVFCFPSILVSLLARREA